MTEKRSSGLSYGVVAIIVIIAFLAGAGVGVGGWIYVMGGSGEASRTVQEAIADIEAENDTEDTTASASDDDTDTDAQTSADTEENTEAGAQTADDTTDDTTTEDDTASTETVEYTIVTEQSEASFTLEEDLRGVRTTVVGTTPDVGGTINVNMDNPSASSVGTIAVNARTIATDSDFRNRAIRSDILQSSQDQYEFIIFEPTSLSNFSAESVSVGDTLTFDVTGNLTITDVTREVTFNTTVTVDSDTQISGTATANVLYADYGLVIPDVPSVANVTEDVDLQITFVATAGTDDA